MSAKPYYNNAEEMQIKIDEYINYCAEFGKPVTVTGLALALGFTTRQALINYQGKKLFVDTITRAKLRAEEYAETRLYDRDGARGAEFSLRCNFGWRADESPPDDGKVDAIINGLTKIAKRNDDESKTE